MPEFKIFKGNPKNTIKMFRHDNTILVYLILLAILIGIIVSSLVIVYNNQQNSDLIQPGVFIKDLNVSGLTKEEAKKMVVNSLSKKMEEHIELRYNNYNYYVELEQIQAEFDIDSCIDIAFNIGKSGHFFDDLKQYITISLLNINIDPVLKYNEESLDNYIEFIELNLPDKLVQYGYYIEDDQLIVTNGSFGVGIEQLELKQEIISAIKDFSYSKKYIDIPVYTVYPEKIDIDKIHNDIYRKVENAYFITEPYAVFAEVEGVDFDTNKLATMINDNPLQEEYIIDLDYTKPEITVNDLGAEAFPDLLASFSTNYYTSNTDRTTNLRLAANKIDGTVVMPGEIFSYNKVVGKRTIAAGYKEAAIYQDGEVTNGLGGGICQISTTLYNAAIKAGMLIEERRNHMFVPSYASAGTDATVVWGSTDFKFENRRNYPVKIETSVRDGVANIKIYGLKTSEDYDIYNLSIGTKVKKNTASSLVVESYRIYKDANGNVVRQDKLYTDTYKKS